VDARVDVKRAARRLALGKFMNAGQTCVAPDFVCADERIRGDLAEAIRATVKDFYGAEPSRSPDYARIVNRRHFDRLLGLLSGDATSVGSHDPERLVLAPTILERATWDDPAMAEEIFGPVLPILGYREIAGVLEDLARRPRPLALYVFSKDRGFQERVIDGTSSGSVCVNDTVLQVTNLNLPFGGVGASGMGRYHGRFGFETFSHERAIMRRWLRWNPFAAYPPYGLLLDRVRRLLR
jgi:aldehyde dehydrogenase (NAD+)